MRESRTNRACSVARVALGSALPSRRTENGGRCGNGPPAQLTRISIRRRVTGLVGCAHVPSRVPRWWGYLQLPRGSFTYACASSRCLSTAASTAAALARVASRTACSIRSSASASASALAASTAASAAEAPCSHSRLRTRPLERDAGLMRMPLRMPLGLQVFLAGVLLTKGRRDLMVLMLILALGSVVHVASFAGTLRAFQQIPLAAAVAIDEAHGPLSEQDMREGVQVRITPFSPQKSATLRSQLADMAPPPIYLSYSIRPQLGPRG
jgi:hypothetical protein